MTMKNMRLLTFQQKLAPIQILSCTEVNVTVSLVILTIPVDKVHEIHFT